MQSKAIAIDDLTDELCSLACKHLEACGYTPAEAASKWRRVSLKNLGVKVIYGEQDVQATIAYEAKLRAALQAVVAKRKSEK